MVGIYCCPVHFSKAQQVRGDEQKINMNELKSKNKVEMQTRI